MTAMLWGLGGLLAGALLMLPIVRLRALEAERLAELGSMTSGLAHEIKNPLSTIGLNAQLLQEAVRESGLPDDERERLVRRIESLRREVERLAGILGDFLQFAGRMQLHIERVNVVKLVDELSDFYHSQCDKAGVVLRTQLPSEPVEVLIDEAMTKQAVLNLMINAVQAMSMHDGASKELMVRVDVGEEAVRVHVTDTGPGIPADRLDSIFRPYVTHGSGGTGLGLPTARRIMNEQGGTLEVNSEVGQGSEFVLVFAKEAPGQDQRS
jgi:signal transduction histidine kinase